MELYKVGLIQGSNFTPYYSGAAPDNFIMLPDSRTVPAGYVFYDFYNVVAGKDAKWIKFANNYPDNIFGLLWGDHFGNSDLAVGLYYDNGYKWIDAKNPAKQEIDKGLVTVNGEEITGGRAYDDEFYKRNSAPAGTVYNQTTSEYDPLVFPDTPETPTQIIIEDVSLPSPEIPPVDVYTERVPVDLPLEFFIDKPIVDYGDPIPDDYEEPNTGGNVNDPANNPSSDPAVDKQIEIAGFKLDEKTILYGAAALILFVLMTRK